jgi:phosphate/sulfate permease
MGTQLTWHWVAGTAAIALVIGFVLGWRTLDRRIRKKYGGLKIY